MEAPGPSAAMAGDNAAPEHMSRAAMQVKESLDIPLLHFHSCQKKAALFIGERRGPVNRQGGMSFGSAGKIGRQDTNFGTWR
jgi:hypothetical protein